MTPGARKAARVRRGIAKVGEKVGTGTALTGTITRVTGADTNTYPPTPGTETDYTAVCMVDDYSAQERAALGVSAHEVRVTVTVPLVDSSGNQTGPRNGDTVTLSDGRTYHLSTVKAEQPGGVVLFWECRAGAGE